MSQQHEQFNLDRQISIENMIDPTGKKWEIKGKRGAGLVHARPNPDRADAQIPKEFKGQWTSSTTLRNLIITWLNKMWTQSERAALEASMKGKARVVEKEPVVEPKQTPEESLDALSPEIKAELGGLLRVAEPEVEEKEEPKPVVKKKATKKGK